MDAAGWGALSAIGIAVITAVSSYFALRFKASTGSVDAVRTELEKAAARIRELEIERQKLVRQTQLQRAEIDTLTRLISRIRRDQDVDPARVVTDKNGIIIEWSTGATLLFGFTAVEAIGQDVSQLIVPHDLRGVHQAGIDSVHAQHRQPREVPISTRALNNQGHEFPVEVKLTKSWRAADGNERYAATIRATGSGDAIPIPKTTLDK